MASMANCECHNQRVGAQMDQHQQPQDFGSPNVFVKSFGVLHIYEMRNPDNDDVHPR